MPSEKPLPDTDDDIIDLTDLVEEGSAGSAAPGDGAPVDMSFEQELEDLFGDAGPAPAKAAAPGALESDEDIVDLAGLGLDDFEGTAAPTPADTTTRPAKTDADLGDLFGQTDAGQQIPVSDFGAHEEAPSGGLDFTVPETGPAAPRSADQDLVPEIPGLADTGKAPSEAEPDLDEAMDLSDMTLAEFEPGPAATEAAPPAPEHDVDMADLLGELPQAPDTATEGSAAEIAEQAGPPSVATTPAATGEAAEEQPAAAVGQATLAPLAAAAGATVGAIDLGALDRLIDAAKGPQPEPEPQEPAEVGRLDALDKRLESLESVTATLFDKIETMPPATDGDALADALSERLEDALSERLEAVLAGQPPIPELPDVETLKVQILDAAAQRASEDRASLLEDVRQAMAPEFAALREELPATADLAGKAETAAALAGLHAALARLEALTQGRQTKFEDFAETMEARLAELHRELPPFENFATTESLAASLVTLGENLSRDIAGKLDERMAELRRDLRETLTTDITASLEEKLSEAAETARQSARTEVEALGEVLSERIEALESDRIDPDALADRVREALIPSLPDAGAMAKLSTKLDREDLEAALSALRSEMAAEIQNAVPRAAATVIREEIAALAKELS